MPFGFWGTTEQETGVSAACWVANILLSARDRRIWRNGHGFVCKSPLQKPKLVRQLLQSQIANLLTMPVDVSQVAIASEAEEQQSEDEHRWEHQVAERHVHRFTPPGNYVKPRLGPPT
jgi:hypothetical protein